MPIINYRSRDYFNMGKWAQPVLPGVEWCYWNTNEAVKQSGRGYVFESMLILDGNFPTKKGDTDKIEKIVNEVRRSGESGKYSNLLDKVGREHEQQHLNVLKNQSVPIEEYLPQLFSTYREMVGFWTFTLLLGDVMDSYILKNKLAESPEDMWEKLAPYARITWLEEQSQEIKQIAQRLLEERSDINANQVTEDFILELPEISRVVDEHVKKFRWFGTHHWLGDGYDRTKCIADIKAVIQKRVSTSEKENSNREKAEDPFWQLLATATYWRTHCAEATGKVIFESRSKMEECAKRLGLSYEGLLNLSAKEISGHLKEGTVASLLANYEQRKEAYGCYIDGKGNEHIITGQKLKELLGTLISVTNTDVQEFRGAVASKGKVVTGSVKVLIAPKDFAKFNEGDVLVAPETTPDFVPYMKKAAAIVTDRGGITSHAAIVSRELGIPCIIGTAVATQILKDGMKVRVDTGSGMVAIVNEV